MKLRLWAALAASAWGLVACNKAPEAPVATETDVRGAQVAQFADRLHQHVAVLASDEFEGRAPATAGEEKTVSYLADEFAKLGLVPGNDGSWFQDVPVVASTLTNKPVLNIALGEDSLALNYGSEMMAWTKREAEATAISESEMVFVGYGIVAPEYQWDDYQGLDVKGKTVVVLVNDPGYATQEDSLFTGNAMTYYGRWTYKYEEAARQGAAGVFIVHETGAAGYPWEVVSGSWSGDQISLASVDKGADRVAVEGWLHNDQARDLFARAGQDFDALVASAHSRDFTPVTLGATASIELENAIRYSRSQNVLALVPGHKRSDEVVVYMAHWDHLGKKPGAEGEDHIFNGAVDNATGTSALLGLAEAFMAVEQSLDRSVLFVAVTAEESGLLGSAYYAQQPTFANYKTVGGINMDAMNVAGPTRDVVVIGYGASDMDNLLKDAADKQARTLVREPTPEKGYFYRSDHFNMAKVGVPMLYAKGGLDHRTLGREYGTKMAADYGANRYHKPADEYDPEWDLTGAAEDMQLYYDIGYRLATGDEYPRWRETSEFYAPRAESIEACVAAGETRCPQ